MLQTTEATSTLTRKRILYVLDKWIRQRPGLEHGNYGDPVAYRAELRSITKDLHDAQSLLAAVRWRDSIPVDMLREAFRSAYSGRLTLNDDGSLDYCTGQYWPTEYRKAACAVLASVLWAYTRETMPAPVGRLTRTHGEFETEHDAVLWQGKQVSPGDWIRLTLRSEFGRGIASRWFS